MKMSNRCSDASHASFSEVAIESSAPDDIVSNDGKWFNARMQLKSFARYA